MKVRAIRMDSRDSVAVVTADVNAGETVALDDGTEVKVVERIPRGGKVALAPIAPGEAVLRYGTEIGLATQAIAAGQHVHTHNLGGKG
jgi:altronate hydrolase